MHGMHWPMHTHTRRLLVCHTSALTIHIKENVAFKGIPYILLELKVSYILLELEVFHGQQLGQEMTDSLASMKQRDNCKGRNAAAESKI